ncbi:hypothetical protein EVAR_76441_1 [Eumeta japonica]|uniref:Uncharacterized protein n=1 Tax=Eumeta variegata TaxID=151549 RepID=A0A4C1T914_EUMVA|nr:hypothetical protein EVAR_76441_1 [Eumeta japonica]
MAVCESLRAADANQRSPLNNELHTSGDTKAADKIRSNHHAQRRREVRTYYNGHYTLSSVLKTNSDKDNASETKFDFDDRRLDRA